MFTLYYFRLDKRLGADGKITRYSNSVVPNLFLMVNHVKYGILIFHNYLKCLVFLVLFEEIVSF